MKTLFTLIESPFHPGFKGVGFELIFDMKLFEPEPFNS